MKYPVSRFTRNWAVTFARKRLGWSQIRLAREAQTHLHYVQACELGGPSYRPCNSEAAASRLATVLDLPIADVVNEKITNAWLIAAYPKPVVEFKDECCREEIRYAVNKAFYDLKPREQIIIRYRLGLFGRDEHTLEQIGQKLRLTRERVRQILFGAMAKLAVSLNDLKP